VPRETKQSIRVRQRTDVNLTLGVTARHVTSRRCNHVRTRIRLARCNELCQVALHSESFSSSTDRSLRDDGRNGGKVGNLSGEFEAERCQDVARNSGARSRENRKRFGLDWRRPE